MSSMAVGANRRAHYSRRDSASVHAFLISNERLRCKSAGLHYKLQAVAGAACRRNIRVIDFGFGITGRKQFVWAAMAIDTDCRTLIARGYRFCVKAAIINRLLIRMALRALHLGRSGLVHRTLDVAVAVHASEHAAMDGSAELFGRHIETDWLAIDLFGEGRIAMTSQAIVIRRFLCSLSA